MTTCLQRDTDIPVCASSPRDASFRNALLALAPAERRRVSTLLEIFAAISHATAQGDQLLATIQRLARRAQHLGRGHSAKNLHRLYTAWRDSGHDWRTLVRAYKAPEGLPQEFLRYWGELALSSPRDDSGKGAHAELLRRWFAGEHIPGYGKIQQWWPANRHRAPLPTGVIVRPGDTPEGWSYGNLMRNIPKRKATRLLNRRGFHAAHGELAQLLRDRANLRPLQLVTFDDVRLDLQAIFPVDGDLKIAYLNAVFALDVGTGRILAYGSKPAYRRDDGTKVGIARADVRFLVCHLLERYGLPTGYPLHLLLENAAAALSPADTAALQEAFPGQLTIETTGLVRRQLLTGGFTEQGGMPWQKGWIEAYFRRLQTHLSLTDGSTGNRYDNDPGTLAPALKYTRDLLKTAAATPGFDPEVLQFPILKADQAEKVLAELVERLNWRTDHALQGFETLYEWQHPRTGDWLPIEDLQRLPPDARLDIRPHARLESPEERWRRLLPEACLTPVHPTALLPLTLDRRTVSIRSSQVRLDNQIYDGRDHLTDHHEGQRLTAYRSADAATLHLFDDRLTYIATIPRVDRVDLADPKAIKRAAGIVHRSREAEIATAATYGEERSARLADMRATNASTLQAAGHAIATAQQTRATAAQEARAAAARLADITDADADDLLTPLHRPTPTTNDLPDPSDIF